MDICSIEVSLVEAVIVPTLADNTEQYVEPYIEMSREPLKGFDTTSFTKSISYSFSNILGNSTFRVGARWDCNIPTGNITQIDRWLNHVSGAVGTFTVTGSGNNVIAWHGFFNGSMEQNRIFSFTLTSNGNIVQN